MNTPRSLAITAAVLLGGASALQAQVYYDQNFDSLPLGSLPVGWSKAAGNNWAVGNVHASSAPNSLSSVDNSATGYHQTSFSFGSILPAAGVPVMNLQFDLRVDHYQVPTLAALGTFRVSFRTTNLPADQYAIGLGYANINGSGETFFYAGAGASPTPSAANAIGYLGDGQFADGFAFGDPDGSAASGTNESFYRFSITYDSVAGEVAVVVQNLNQPSQTVTYLDSWDNGKMMSNLSQLIVTTGTASQGDMYFDNFSARAIPEPSSVVALGLGGVALLAASRRRKK